MAKEIPWDEQTDMFISDLEENVSKRYSISLRSLLISPDRYLGKTGMAEMVKHIKEDVDAYFSELIDGMDDEKQKLQAALESVDSQYKQVNTLISSKAAAARVPYVKPLFVSRDEDRDELVVIAQYDEMLEAFVGRLVNVSNYVADLSSAYKEFHIGSWLFSGAKNHVLSINPPANPILTMENSRAVIGGMLDDIATRAS